jgi:hypothetical protein
VTEGKWEARGRSQHRATTTRLILLLSILVLYFSSFSSRKSPAALMTVTQARLRTVAALRVKRRRGWSQM